MSLRYKGAVISATPPTTTGGESGVASGSWTLEQQFQAQGAGNWPEPFVAKYIEDVFSTYLYTGNNGSQTITNNIDLSTKGGMVWIKNRQTAADHDVTDTARGARKPIFTNSTVAQDTNVDYAVNSFLTTGFTLNSSDVLVNALNQIYASWTFRKQPKFFDVVTYTGNATARTIAHNLGSVPGCIIVKRTDSTGGWYTYHRSTGADKELLLNSTASAQTDLADWNNTSPTSTVFSVGTPTGTNINGATYVAYLFAHDAGGFGLTGSDNVISCGSYTGNGSSTGPITTLGYEPQWVMIKRATGGVGNWAMHDTMRGMSMTSDAQLYANLSDAESVLSQPIVQPNSTGFQIRVAGGDYNASGSTYIYIAIRRGPMKVPTSGTSVFSPNAQAGNGGNDTVTTGFTTDLVIGGSRTANPIQGAVDRLRGRVALLTANTAAEDPCPSGRDLTSFASNTGFTLGYPPFATSFNYTGNNIYWNFRRAPSFFDVVCYTGTGSSQYLNHALGVDPELIICKKRSAATSWGVQMQLATKPFNGTYTFARGAMSLDSTAASTLSDTGFTNTTVFNPQYVTDTNATYGTQNASGATFVAYLFATCPGVSKVGSYTGTGATQTISCGFTGGARFVLIKRTDSTGDWYVWDTARGMVSGTDPSLLLNSTAAEVNANSIYTATTGFQIVSTAAGINASGGTYIYLAIA